MDDARRVREAALDALADIDPDTLRTAIADRLQQASMTPGALTLLSARALGVGLTDGLAERAAGVQLIYEGLRLTRSLAHEEPWSVDPEGDISADLDILAADVLVSRGFYLLARTGAAAKAVETVRAFGRDQTRRREPEADPAALDRNLEVDVFVLAVVAGTTAAGHAPSEALRSHVADLARSYEGDLPPAAAALPDSLSEHVDAMSGPDDPDRLTSSATDP